MAAYSQVRLSNWFIDKDEDNRGIADGWTGKISATAKKTQAPSIIQQTLPEYHGLAFYWCAFTPSLEKENKADRFHIRFMAVDYAADVWLNGEKLGRHEGGETPFEFDVTDLLRNGEENLLTVRVLNPNEKDVDGLNIINVANRNKVVNKRAGSTLNYGGICQDVILYRAPALRLADVYLTGDIKTGKLTAKIRLDNGTDKTPAEVSVSVSDKTYGQLIAKRTETVPAGADAVTVEVTVPEHRLWSVDDPFLYRVETEVRSAYGNDRDSRNFGFREFCLKDGWFFLNGQKLFVKSAHTGNVFPGGQIIPADISMANQDFWLAKSCGFNMIRAFSGMLRPEQLDFCDEIGLLIYEECNASWGMGIAWMNDVQVGDEKAMARRWVSVTEEMILRDRSRTCIVMWGLLNEMEDGIIFRTAADFLPRARELDPTRLVLLNSGRFDGVKEIGCASNPGSSVWEFPWGGYEWEDPWGKCGCSDFHFYPVVPICAEDERKMRTVGNGEKPVFLSEFGTGAMFDVIDEWQRFLEKSLSEDLEDASWLKKQSEDFRADWKRLGLDKVWPDPEFMLRESQRINADARLRDFNIVRSNPGYCGYSLTGLLDHGMCGEGLWTLWRRMKPQMFDALCDGWAKLRFCLFAKSHIFTDEELTLEAVLANDGVLKPGEYEADLSVVGDAGTVLAMRRRFTVDAGKFAVPVMKETVKITAPAGAYRFCAQLVNGGSPAGNSLTFYVSDPEKAIPDCKELSAIGLADTTLAHLKGCGCRISDGPTAKKTVLVGKQLTDGQYEEALTAAEKGAVTVFLSPELFLKNGEYLKKTGIADDLRMMDRRDWLYHKECLMVPGTVFFGLGTGLVDSPRFGQTFPHPALETKKTPDRVICPAFYTGYYDFEGSYGCAHVVSGFRYGKGYLIFNCFDIENNLDKEPAAGILLRNLIDYAADCN